MKSSTALLLAVGLGLAGRKLMERRGRRDSLAGDVAVVTGGSRGLGLLIARELLREGCRVAICARDGEELEAARSQLAAEGEVVALRCDVAAADDVDTMVAAVRRRLGPVDMLVNNAGVIQVGPVESQTLADYRSAMDVMFWGTVHCTLAVLQDMLARGRGRIVNITSIGGKVAVPHLLPYESAKFAAVGFSEGLRSELASRGVRVTTIVPGLMRTGSYVNAYFKGSEELEFRLFGLLANAPLISMDAERAARQVVEATRRRTPERVLGAPAQLTVAVNALFPGAVSRIVAWVNRSLPRSDDRSPARRGLDVYERARGLLFDAATVQGRRAARRFQRLQLAR